jgi:hypothetical protein
VLYLTVYLWPGHAAACLERNQLMPGSIGLSPLYAGHTNDLHINTACGPPRNFRHASTCPRIDHRASGLALLTPRTFNTSSHARRLRTCCFRFGFPCGLTLPAGQTLWPVLQNVSYNAGRYARTTASRRVPSRKSSFHAITHHHLSISGAFNHLSRVTFQLSLTLLLRYRFRGVFSFGG